MVHTISSETPGLMVWPVGNERCARSALEHTVFATTVGSSGFVVSHFLKSFVLVPVVPDGSVVRAEYDHGIFLETLLFEVLYNFSNAPVELDDDVPAVTQPRFVTKALVWDAWNMQIMGSEEEEWVVLVFPNPLDRFLDPLVGQILIPEACGVATGVEADPANPIVNSRVVPVGPIHFQGMAVGHSCGMVGAWLSFLPKGDPWGEIEHTVVLDVDLWNPIIGGGEQKAVIESDLTWPGLEFVIPLRTDTRASQS